MPRSIGMTEIHFPGETPEYRAARDELLAAEHELVRQIERVAALRRSLPAGDVVPEDYSFTGVSGPVSLSSLFGERDTLALYSFMYSPEMERPCQMCTSFLDGLDGGVPDIGERIAFGVVAKSPIERISAFAAERNWRYFRLISSYGTNYGRDYLGEDGEGNQQSRMTVFIRRDGEIRHFYSTEKQPTDPGENDRHIDLMWPLWNVLDLTPAGRGADWYPEFSPK